MRIYVAGKWEERANIRDLMDILEGDGHTITEDWTTHEAADRDLAECALRDHQGVETADALVIIAINVLPYMGACAELGLALGYGKEIYLVGSGMDTCVFAHHPAVHRLSWPAVRGALRR